MHDNHTLRPAVAPRLAPLALVAAALAVSGCNKPEGKVSKDQLNDVKAVSRELTPGESKSTVLDRFDHGEKTRLGVATVDGTTVEEWQVRAYHKRDDRTESFSRYLYFVNDRLADSSDVRIDFRDRTELVSRWRNATR